jgi:hypothetical protein
MRTKQEGHIRYVSGPSRATLAFTPLRPFDSPRDVQYHRWARTSVVMASAMGIRNGRSTAAVLAVAALLFASLHGVIPHPTLTGACHECETLASPALLPQPESIARPATPALARPLRYDARPADPPDTRLRPTRAPPTDSAS